jgi:hypothetical protein
VFVYKKNQLESFPLFIFHLNICIDLEGETSFYLQHLDTQKIIILMLSLRRIQSTFHHILDQKHGTNTGGLLPKYPALNSFQQLTL